MKKYLTIKVFPILLGVCMTSAALADGVTLHVLGGISLGDQGNTQNLTLNSAYESQYNTSSQESLSPFIGLGVGYQWDQVLVSQFAFNLSADAYYLQSNLSGTTSAIVGGQSFNELNYTLSQNSTAIMLEPKFIYTAYSWQPYVLFGLGFSINQLGDYNETTPAGSGIVPVTPQFQHHTDTHFAYSFGVGMQHTLLTSQGGNTLALAVEYRYMNWGEMGLGPAPGQETSQSIQYNTVQSNLIDAGLIWQFN